tara:strand:+ start:373 stop:3600 length:3228 start_codon:yes stop_codon:yes gene_type:complete
MSIVGSAGSGLGGAGDIGGALGSFYSHTIDQSLRFEDGDSPYLSRTPSGAGNQKVWTWSAWVKRANITSEQTLFGAYKGANDYVAIQFDANDTLNVTYKNVGASGGSASSQTRRKITTQVFRDVSSWYNIVVKFDAGNTNCDIYVNGTEVTSFSVNEEPQDLSFEVNAAQIHYIGTFQNSVTGLAVTYFDGYMAEINLIDGTALGPDSFGETKDGVWIPKDASDLTFGTNGFYLPFAVTQGDSAFFDGSGDTIKFTNASHYDIASDDDFTVEFFFNHPAVDSYGDFLGNYATDGPHFMVGFDNRTEKDFYFYTGNGASIRWQLASNSGIVADTWHHIAFQRNGTVLRCYVDGVRQTNCTDSASNTGYTISGGNVTDFDKAYDLAYTILGEVQSGGGFVTGFLSNVRLVIGASVYANDDNNITVPTATLANVSGTALLALTTGAITKDSSDNDVTGTVAGTTVYRQNNPFSTIIGKDAAGSNNFADSGLAFTDVVPDSPTNNFATMNLLHKASSSVTLSEGNLKAAMNSSSGSGYTIAPATMPLPLSGKWYWEADFSGANTGGSLTCFAGVFDSTIPVVNKTANFVNSAGDYIMWYSHKNSIRNSSLGNTNNFQSHIDTQASGTVSFAIDMDNRWVWVAVNGVYINGTPDFSDGTNRVFLLTEGVTYIPFFAHNGGSGGGWEVNFGQDSANVSSANSDANGIGTFEYAVPSGYTSLCSANLPEPDIIDGSEYFNTVLWAGNDVDDRSISGVGFQPDWTWIKQRSAPDRSHCLVDSVRGATKRIKSDVNDLEDTFADGVQAFESDGFQIGTNNTVNLDPETYVAWNWLAGTAVSGATTGSGTAKTYTGSVNTKSGFSIIKYVGNGTAGHTIPHNLTVGGVATTPTMIMVKRLDADGGWRVQNKGVAATQYLALDTTAKETDSNTIFNDTAFNSTVFTVGTADSINSNDAGSAYIAYCFTDIEGFSKAGGYSGNGIANGTFIHTGFRPAWILVKRFDSATGSYWDILDNKRNATSGNPVDEVLMAHVASDEGDLGNVPFDFLSNGFKPRDTTVTVNGSSGTYIYLAFAEQPFKYANAR